MIKLWKLTWPDFFPFWKGKRKVQIWIVMGIKISQVQANGQPCILILQNIPSFFRSFFDQSPLFPKADKSMEMNTWHIMQYGCIRWSKNRIISSSCVHGYSNIFSWKFQFKQGSRSAKLDYMSLVLYCKFAIPCIASVLLIHRWVMLGTLYPFFTSTSRGGTYNTIWNVSLSLVREDVNLDVWLSFLYINICVYIMFFDKE